MMLSERLDLRIDDDDDDRRRRSTTTKIDDY
jgi:hypothetical protein